MFGVGLTAIAGIAAFGWWLLAQQRRNTTGMPDFTRSASLLNTQQRALYHVLTQVVGSNATIMTKVSLANLVHKPEDISDDHWKRVLRQWLDFVLCSSSSISPVVAIKLETRLERRRRKLGGFDVLEDTLTSAGIPLLRFRVEEGYEAAEVMHRIRIALVNQKQKHESEMFDTEEVPVAPALRQFAHRQLPTFRRWLSEFLLVARGMRRAS